MKVRADWISWDRTLNVDVLSYSNPMNFSLQILEAFIPRYAENFNKRGRQILTARTAILCIV